MNNSITKDQIERRVRHIVEHKYVDGWNIWQVIVVRAYESRIEDIIGYTYDASPTRYVNDDGVDNPTMEIRADTDCECDPSDDCDCATDTIEAAVTDLTNWVIEELGVHNK